MSADPVTLLSSGISIILVTDDFSNGPEAFFERFFKENTEHPVEVIIIDHGPKADTTGFMQKYAHRGFIRYIKREGGHTFVGSFLFALARARHRFLLLVPTPVPAWSVSLPQAASILSGTPAGAAVGIFRQKRDAAEIGGMLDHDSTPSGARAEAKSSKPMSHLRIFSSRDCLRLFASQDPFAGPAADSPGRTLEGFLFETQPIKNIFSKEELLRQGKEYYHENQWSVAHFCFKTALETGEGMPSSEEFSSVSDMLFDMDDFAAARHCLQKSLTLSPANPRALASQANQFFYQAYSSWLMTDAGEDPSRRIFSRPDWNAAARLCARFVKKGGGSPAQARRFFQASLLAAEECRDGGEHEAATATLLSALQTLLPEVPMDVVHGVTAAVDHVRRLDGQCIEQETESTLAMVAGVEGEILPAHKWMLLHDLLNWNGLLRCGLAVRRHAVRQAVRLGTTNSGDPEAVLLATRAAMEQGAFDAARGFLAQPGAMRADPRAVAELTALLLLQTGDMAGFHRHFPFQPAAVDLKYQDYVRKKRVSIVGPAPTGALHGDEIDGCDVVVRFNFREPVPDHDAAAHGTRTHVSLYNAHGFRQLVATNNMAALAGLDFCLLRRPRYDLESLGVDCARIRKIQEARQLFSKSFNAAPAAVFDMLFHDAARIKLFNVTFFSGAEHHCEHYKYRKDCEIPPLRRIQPVLANHDLLCQTNFVRNVWKAGLVEVDEECRDVLNQSDEEYISRIEQDIFPKNPGVPFTGFTLRVQKNAGPRAGNDEVQVENSLLSLQVLQIQEELRFYRQEYHALKDNLNASHPRSTGSMADATSNVMSEARLPRTASSIPSPSDKKKIDFPKYVLFSHHPKELNRGICSSVHQLLVGQKRVTDLHDYLCITWDPATFAKHVNTALDGSCTLFFNGLFSLVMDNAITALKRARALHLPVTIYWHETAWNFRVILGKKDRLPRIRELLGLLPSLDVTNWVTSTQCMHTVATVFGFPFESFKVVYEIVDMDRFQPAPPSPAVKSSTTVVGAGLPDYRKGADRFAYVASQVKKRSPAGVTFRWYNSDPAHTGAPDHPHAEAVSWNPFTPEFDAALKGGGLFLLTSRDDPFPLVVLEALACGLPAICFSSTGYGEVLPQELVVGTTDEMVSKALALIGTTGRGPRYYRTLAGQFDIDHFVSRAFGPQSPETNNVRLPDLRWLRHVGG